jgi:hypothetical protein
MDTIAPLAGTEGTLLFDKVLAVQMLNDYADALRAAKQPAAGEAASKQALELANRAFAETPNWPLIRHERDRAARSHGHRDRNMME